MQTPHDKTPFVDIIRNYSPAIVMIGAGFVSLVLTWKSVGDTAEGLNSLREQVQRQYGTQREMNEKTNAEVDELKLWKAWTDGYNEAKKETSKQ
jgi:hypothetical protein